MTIYLYVKWHSVTGLKYFGYTQNNPLTTKYYGSGIYWTSHIEKHGRKYVQDICFWIFEDQESASNFALDFSKRHNIVESNEWANLVIEDAKPGAGVNALRNRTYKEIYGESADYQKQIRSEAMTGFKHSNEVIDSLRSLAEAQYADPDQKQKHYDAACEFNKIYRIWINDGKINKRVLPENLHQYDFNIWKKGRLGMTCYEHIKNSRDPKTGRFMKKENI